MKKTLKSKIAVHQSVAGKFHKPQVYVKITPPKKKVLTPKKLRIFILRGGPCGRLRIVSPIGLKECSFSMKSPVGPCGDKCIKM